MPQLNPLVLIMKFYSHRLIYCFLLFCTVLLGCKGQTEHAIHTTVYVKNQHGRYILYRNGQAFTVKGGAGFTNLEKLNEAGGNTIRVFDTLNLVKILDSAQAHHIAVIVGLPFRSSESTDDFYSDDNKVKANFNKLALIVNRIKRHPALLCWCLGNELVYPFKPKYNKFYKAFNDVVDLIHREDGMHPVTTTVMGFQKKNIFNIKFRTHVDFISFNIFGSIKTLGPDLENFKWLWNGPFLITEWGIEGPWTADQQNAWGAYVENTSNKKAEEYLSIYKNYMPVGNPRFLGATVFYWGQKQEYTPTWFSLFDKDGKATETVNSLQYIWTGKKAGMHAPPVKYMLLNNKGGFDNILLKPGAIAHAKIYLNTTDTARLTYKWLLYPEDWYTVNKIYSQKPPKLIEGAFKAVNGSEVAFKTPAKEGPYRLFVYIYGNNGYFSTSNTPFYILSNP